MQCGKCVVCLVGAACLGVLVLLHGLTVQVVSVADVLEVAARVFAAQLRLGPVRLQPGVVAPPVLGARRHAAGRAIPHCVYALFLRPPLYFTEQLVSTGEKKEKRKKTGR